MNYLSRGQQHSVFSFSFLKVALVFFIISLVSSILLKNKAEPTARYDFSLPETAISLKQADITLVGCYSLDGCQVSVSPRNAEDKFAGGQITKLNHPPI